MTHHHTDHGHGHENKPKTIIIINGSQKEYDGARISYSEVVQLAFPGSSSDIVYSINYSWKNELDGTLYDGQFVTVKKGMEFDVTPTNRS
ncbi:MAG: multiubiquitin domain-containing protein [Thiotrichales bacterium]|nr:multiubiquitin domain-containing protein [Thiotrichales bacterium]